MNQSDQIEVRRKSELVLRLCGVEPGSHSRRGPRHRGGGAKKRGDRDVEEADGRPVPTHSNPGPGSPAS
jgi:hypothetical protein